jgi:Tol biopolymer transport system component
MGSKSPPVILMMVALLCAIIPAALGAALPPSAFAQQEEETSLGEEEEREDLASDNIVSDVLDSVDDDEENDEAATGDGDINRQTAVPITEQDQGAANLALNEALDVTVAEPLPPPTTTPPDDGGLEPECSLEITTDKETYGSGDTVAITITNTGDVPLDFPNSALGLQIKNIDTGQVFPIEALQELTRLQPDESRTFELTYEELVEEIGTGLISATVVSECRDGGGASGTEEVTFRLSAAPPQGTIPRENGKIAYTSQGEYSNRQIYVINPDGSGRTNISNNPAFYDQEPDWSPDGTKIAFESFHDPNDIEISVMNSDGSGRTSLTNNPGYDRLPSWSPDGEKIAFLSLRDGGNYEIYVMNAADGSDVTRLTNNAYVADSAVSWSPDGEKIAFTSYRDGNAEIYVMNAADGSEQTRLTNHPEADLQPDWSPDGEKIAFLSLRDSGNYEIYVMNAADGSDVTSLTNNLYYSTDPSWSPDGTKIAFNGYGRLGSGIYIMNSDGSEQTYLRSPYTDFYPDWGSATDGEYVPPEGSTLRFDPDTYTGFVSVDKVQRALELNDEELQALDLSILEFTYRTIDLSTWQCQNDANPTETSDRWTQHTTVRTINYEVVGENEITGFEFTGRGNKEWGIGEGYDIWACGLEGWSVIEDTKKTERIDTGTVQVRLIGVTEWIPLR